MQVLDIGNLVILGRLAAHHIHELSSLLRISPARDPASSLDRLTKTKSIYSFMNRQLPARSRRESMLGLALLWVCQAGGPRSIQRQPCGLWVWTGPSRVSKKRVSPSVRFSDPSASLEAEQKGMKSFDKAWKTEGLPQHPSCKDHLAFAQHRREKKKK
ncbi:hypothetical protein BD289DRAFT_109402 [Coniella lustricola]|uniref:Uncharacterized protein n=1 Tax=Coniella lustricola TaxID=2025994 RepID=A0A2T2ZXI3_9PEZI|nr:hypothetical protein BD289DRAFT_109402 [Coniella lustricola]